MLTTKPTWTVSVEIIIASLRVRQIRNFHFLIEICDIVFGIGVEQELDVVTFKTDFKQILSSGLWMNSVKFFNTSLVNFRPGVSWNFTWPAAIFGYYYWHHIFPWQLYFSHQHLNTFHLMDCRDVTGFESPKCTM